jgi:hypothetical protein
MLAERGLDVSHRRRSSPKPPGVIDAPITPSRLAARVPTRARCIRARRRG